MSLVTIAASSPVRSDLRGRLTLPASPGPWCKQLLSRRGSSGGRGTAGGFGLNLEVSMGMMAGFGDRMVSFLGTDEIIMHRVVEAEICT